MPASVHLRGSVAVALLLALAACSDPPTVLAPTEPSLKRDAPFTAVITDLGPLQGGGWPGRADAINAHGEVVGGAFTGGIGGRLAAFRWTERTGAVPLDTTGLIAAGARDVNDRGDVVGTGCPEAGGTCHAVVWLRTGQTLHLTSPFVSALNAINDRGLAVGASGGAVAWSIDGGIRPLEQGASALDVNRRGDIVGSALGGRAAIWWHGGEVTFLPTPTGPGATATGINDRGDVVGFIGSHFFSTGFVWSERDGLRLLAAPAGWFGHPEAIDKHGAIAGWINQGGSSSPSRAVMWTAGGQLVELGALAAGASSAAYDIDDHGRIVGASEAPGSMFGSHAVLWTVSGRDRHAP